MELIFALLGGLTVGLIIGAAGMYIRQSRMQQALLREHESTRARNDSLNAQAQQHLAELEQMRTELRTMNERRELAERESARQQERIEALEKAEQRLKETFGSLSVQALKSNSTQFIELAKTAFESLMKEAKGDVEKKQQAIDSLIKPIRELLDKQNSKLSEIEKQREADKSGLREHLTLIAEAHQRLGQETNRLVTALRRSHHRGRWGEMALRNAVELAGMSEHCDFHEQAQTDDPSTRDRPDMTVRLPGGGTIVVDSKVALDAYLNAIEPDADRDAELQRHVRQIETHVRQLSSKKYWAQFNHAPQLVVMFMPLESALTAALEHKPDLHADAMSQHVLISTPTLLIALLRAVAYGWQQQAIAENARQIANVGRELYDRINTFANHFVRVGKGLESANKSYNSAVGSLERNLLPQARRLRDLGATRASEIAGPDPIEVEVREVTAPDLRQLPSEHDR